MFKLLLIVLFQFRIVCANTESDETMSNDTSIVTKESSDTWADFNCTFEHDICNWTIDKFSDAPWQVTPAIYNIPSPPQGNNFLRLNYNRRKKWGDRGQIFSPSIPSKMRWLRVDFWFYVSSPGVYTYTGLKFGLVSEKLVFHWLFGSAAITNGWSPKWMHVSLCLPKIQPNTRLVFFGEAEKGHEVAIDDVVVSDKVEPCDKITLLSPAVLSQNENCLNSAVTSTNNDVFFIYFLTFPLIYYSKL